MVTQDIETFISLADAITLAARAGVVGEPTNRRLASALASGIITGSMELDDYTRIHRVMADYLEYIFQRDEPAESENHGEGPQSTAPIGAHLEVVGQAMDNVSPGDPDAKRLTQFLSETFDMSGATFSMDRWFSAPLAISFEELVGGLRSVGVMLVSMEVDDVERAITGFDGSLADPEALPTGGEGKLLIGWGDRRLSLFITPR